MIIDDFVELNFSDRNLLNLRPNPDTNLAFHGNSSSNSQSSIVSPLSDGSWFQVESSRHFFSGRLRPGKANFYGALNAVEFSAQQRTRRSPPRAAT
jgi:hypothetical protein